MSLIHTDVCVVENPTRAVHNGSDSYEVNVRQSPTRSRPKQDEFLKPLPELEIEGEPWDELQTDGEYWLGELWSRRIFAVLVPSMFLWVPMILVATCYYVWYVFSTFPDHHLRPQYIYHSTAKVYVVGHGLVGWPCFSVQAIPHVALGCNLIKLLNLQDAPIGWGKEVGVWSMDWKDAVILVAMFAFAMGSSFKPPTSPLNSDESKEVVLLLMTLCSTWFFYMIAVLYLVVVRRVFNIINKSKSMLFVCLY